MALAVQTSTPARHPFGKEPEDIQQRETPDDVVSHVEMDELHVLPDGFVEALLVAVVLVSIQDHVRRERPPRRLSLIKKPPSSPTGLTILIGV
jgi:hypothetical protein